MRNFLISCMCLALAACAYVPRPLDVPGEVCAADVQPPVPRSDSDPKITPPVVLQRVEPHADRSLMGSNTRATVEAVIGEDGVARNICLTSGDPTWGHALAVALRQWKFQPATLDGKPIAVRWTLESAFRGL